MHRTVQGLEWAVAMPDGPFGRPRARGAKAAGLRYERALAKALPSARHGQWFKFRDVNGEGWCQPDLIFPLGPGALLVLEAKYTWVPEAASQLTQLYAPVVEAALGLRVTPVVVCKVLTHETPSGVFSSLRAACSAARPGAPTVFHWPESPKLLEVANVHKAA